MSKAALATHEGGPKVSASGKEVEQHSALAIFLAGRNGKAKRCEIDHKIGLSVMEVKDRVD